MVHFEKYKNEYDHLDVGKFDKWHLDKIECFAGVTFLLWQNFSTSIQHGIDRLGGGCKFKIIAMWQEQVCFFCFSLISSETII